jgi:hypothetical protein
MKRRVAVLLLSLASAFVPAARAQRTPHAGYVYPAGGRQGATFTVTLGGQFLSETTNVFFSGAGIRAAIVRRDRQVTPDEQKELTEKLAKLREKRQQDGLTMAEEKLSAEIRGKLTGFGRKLVNVALNEFVTLQVTIATNAAPGQREIRLGTLVGLSNPLAFHVGELPEHSKKDWKNIPKGRDGMDPEMSSVPNEIRITTPVVVNGQTQPGGIDRFRFAAKQGQRFTVVANARSLLPYLADASPGWFQIALKLLDAQGKEVACEDECRLHSDPVLLYKIPKDGDYMLEVRDSLYRGREDFVYRVVIGDLPYVTGLFPLGGRSGTRTTVTFGGWNLPTSQMTLDLRNQTPGIHPFTAVRFANAAPFLVDTLPECFATTNVQTVALPIIINGRIEHAGDDQVFQFDGRAGERIVAEVMARRLDSPLDSVLRLVGPDGKQIAFNDDHEDKGSGLNTHHADSYLAATLPANGVYSVHLADAQQKGGWAYSYRLRLSAPRPDFELRVAPSGINARIGTTVALTVHALRKDGFDGEIAVSLKDAPKGFSLTAAKVPAKQDKVQITLTVPTTPTVAPLSLQFEGRANIFGRDVVRAAVPADDLTQAFAYRHLVTAQEMKVVVWGQFAPRSPSQILSATPLKIPVGGTARVEASVWVGPRMEKVDFTLNDAPEGISIREFKMTGDRATIVLQAESGKIRAGATGNLIIEAFAERNDPDLPVNRRRVPLGALPAIPFEIVGQ